MATAREYFDKDSSANLRVDGIEMMRDERSGEQHEIKIALALDFEAGAKFGLLLVPDTPAASAIVSHYARNKDAFQKLGEGTQVAMEFHGTDENIESADLVFTNRITVYTMHTFSAEEKEALRALASERQLQLVLRDGMYVDQRNKCEKPVAFICHDSRDKNNFVKDLAAQLQKMLLFVWYDEYSLIAGQSLRASIERGLRDCQKCVLVLSPNFLSNEGWSKAEFDSVFTRELVDEADVIIPIWHNVTRRNVYDYSMRLADKVAIPSSLGIEEVARQVTNAVSHSVR
jgi:TIR domain